MEYQPVDTRFIEAYKRIHASLGKVYRAANRNDLSTFPDTNAQLAREASEWLHIMDDVDEGVDEELLGEADRFLDRMVLLYGIDFSKPASRDTGVNPIYAAV